MPELQSVSVVPVGLTGHREGLYPLEPFTKEDACEVLDLIHRWQDRLYKQYGSHFIHAGDEWYILAERPIPEEETYDGYLQLENGVGMVRLLEEEVKQTLESLTGDDRCRKVTIATGELAAPFLQRHVEQIQEKYPHVEVQVIAVHNDFFGGKITVAGLITGRDLIAQLTGRDLGQKLFISTNMLKSNEPVFLDDVTVSDVEKALQIKISIVESSGTDFVNNIID
jgi:NifB/MoaA-like Fe-S oxidoreductase